MYSGGGKGSIVLYIFACSSIGDVALGEYEYEDEYDELKPLRGWNIFHVEMVLYIQ